MHRSRLLVAGLVLAVAPAALGQELMAPYAEEPAAPPPISPAPVAPPAQPMPPVPPPIVAPPPAGYYQPPYYGSPQYAQPQYAQPQYVVPPPMRMHEVSEPRYGLAIAGAVMLGASWSINAAVAYMADEWKLAVPVVGPFMETQNIDTSPGHEYNRPVVAALVFDGLVETAGAVMLLAGALTHHTVRRYDRASVSVVPAAGPGSAGLAAIGSF